MGNQEFTCTKKTWDRVLYYSHRANFWIHPHKKLSFNIFYNFCYTFIGCTVQYSKSYYFNKYPLCKKKNPPFEGNINLHEDNIFMPLLPKNCPVWNGVIFF